ncbi:MAG TPA: diguanylate cyclase [Acidobacteriaceae bacterium]|nr:diguanylate cyclase [Acidobacteriaceae bacterium]
MGIDVVVLARFLLTGIALLLAFLAVVTWNRREDAPEATTFAVLLASMAVYAFGYAGEIAQTTTAAAHLWLDVEYLALPWAGGLWLLAACKHNGMRGRLSLFFLIPAVTFLGYYTNFRNLFYTAPMEMTQRGPFAVMVVHRGPLSTLDNAYLMVCFLAGAWIYLSGLRHSSSLFRRQAVVLVLSSLLPFVGYFVYLAGLSPWGLDITPVTLGVTCALIYYGIFHCGIFDLAPLARNLIFNSMRDAVLILDTHDRLLDFNPAAKALFPILNKRNLGTGVTPMLAGSAAFAEAVQKVTEMVEVTLDDAELSSYEVRTWPLFTASASAASRLVGRAVIFADVTAQVRLREELRGRAETDPLTGVANRRRFYHALDVECLRFTRNHLQLTVMMIDLDHFKEVNDQYGHLTGDAVLRIVAQLLLLCLRKTDLLARYGGEEFAVLLPETSLAGAEVIAERIRQTICQKPVVAEGVSVDVSVSIGLASHSDEREATPEILLKKADLALYRAKAAGRNRVEAS